MKYYSETLELLFDTEEELIEAERVSKAEEFAREAKKQKMLDDIADIEKQYEELARARSVVSEKLQGLLKLYGTDMMRYITRSDVLYDCSANIFFG